MTHGQRLVQNLKQAREKLAEAQARVRDHKQCADDCERFLRICADAAFKAALKVYNSAKPHECVTVYDGNYASLVDTDSVGIWFTLKSPSSDVTEGDYEAKLLASLRPLVEAELEAKDVPLRLSTFKIRIYHGGERIDIEG
jgi:hypothetical protein